MRSLALILLLTACSAGNGSAAATKGGIDTTGAAAASTSVDQAPFTVQELARFDEPWALAFLPGGAALVTQKGGTLKLWQPGRPAADVAGVPRVAVSGQGGLLDVVLSPGFATDNLVYLSYSEPGPGGSGLALARGRLVRDPGGAQLDGVQVIWHDPAGGRGGQFGAIILFAPDGKSLYLSSGERQRFTPAQDPNQPLGKILHLTLDGQPAPGNPGAGRTGASSFTIIDPPENTEA